MAKEVAGEDLAVYLAMFVDELAERYKLPIDQPTLTGELDVKLAGLNAASANDWRVALVDGLKVCNGLLAYINGHIAAKAIVSVRVPRPARDDKFQMLATLAAAGS